MSLDLQIVGESVRSDGMFENNPDRVSRLGDLIVGEGAPRFYEYSSRGRIYSVALTATTTGVAAGNIVGAAAAAVTNFALWNPPGSGVNLALIKFGMGVVSGTPGAGPMFHSLLVGTVPSVASIGTANNHLVGSGGPKAKFVASAAGSALTGGPALTTLRVANFSSTATAQASVGELNAIELLEGEIVLTQGSGWVPTWGAAGTALLNGYSITWAEIPA